MYRESALRHQLGHAGEVLPLAERTFLGHINLRGRPDDGAFLVAVQEVLGAALPLRPNTTARGAVATLIWLGPDEWLVQAPDELAPLLFGRLKIALAGQFAAVTQVSDGHVVLVLEHPRAVELLSRGCPLDLDESAFPVGTCAQSLLGKTGVLLVREAPMRFALTVRRSFARYLYEALQDAAQLDRPD
jgi:sarcosine oxidase subunit gamma